MVDLHTETALHAGLRAVLDSDSSRYVERSPKGHVRQSVYNGRCAEAHGVEMEAQQKQDGTMEVSFAMFNSRTGTREVVLRLVVPTPGNLWEYEKPREPTFTPQERQEILSGSLTVSPATVEQADREEYGRVEGDDDPDSLNYGGR